MRGSYELQPEPQRPDLPEEFVLCEHAEDAIDTIAADMFLHAQNCVRAFGDFHLAIDGSRFAERLCQTLLLDPLYRSLPWKRTHLWVVADTDADERASDMLRELVAHHADLPAAQFHPIDPSRTGEARRYQARLREHLGWRERGHDRLDFVFLSSDDRGSLPFISHQTAVQTDSLIVEFDSGKSSSVAMTPTLINASRFVTVLAMGAESRPAVTSAISSTEAASGNGFTKQSVQQNGPALAPTGGTLRWYIDPAALPEEHR